MNEDIGAMKMVIKLHKLYDRKGVVPGLSCWKPICAEGTL